MNSSKLKLTTNNTRKRLVFEFVYYLNFLSFFVSQHKFQQLIYTQNLFNCYMSNKLLINLRVISLPKYDKLSINCFLQPNLQTPQIKIFHSLSFPELKSFQLKIYFFSKIINLLFLFNSYVLESSTKLHYNYKLLFGRRISTILWINNNRFIHNWLSFFSFLYNIFYFNLSPLIFGSKIFKKEVLSFNWKFFHTDFVLWKFSFSFFILKANHFTKKINFFYKKISSMGVDFLLISDAFYHIKNLYYFSKYKIFTLGLISASMDPWSVSYAVPGLVNGALTEFFFLKNITLLFQHSNQSKYFFLKKNYALLNLSNRIFF